MRKAAVVGAVFLVSVGAFYYFSPYVALQGLQTAIAEADAAALDERVDFPQLRENLKAQLNAVMLKETSSELEDNPFAALALGFASTMVDGVVDAFVTPSGLANLSKGNRPAPGTGGPPLSDSPTSSDELFEDARLTRDSFDRFSLWVSDDEGGEIQFVFRRSGLGWRLTSIFIPLED